MALSPMMQHYIKTKEQYKDCVVFYRLGDFYEMFFDDAINISKELDLTLTGRDCGMSTRAPMCGIPHHASEAYIAKLIEKGYKVALCEQLTEPNSKGLVERGVVKIVTKGTIMEQNMLDESKNNFIASIFLEESSLNIGLSWADISTGAFFTTEFTDVKSLKILEDNIARIAPTEIICNQAMKKHSDQLACVKYENGIEFFEYDESSFAFDKCKETLLNQLKTDALTQFGCQHKQFSVKASGALLNYLNDTQKRSLSHINKLSFVQENKFMVLDANTRKNLELNFTLRDRKRFGSLLWLLDNTKTAMGARNLTAWINEPLQDSQEIENRLNSVEELKNNLVSLSEIANGLSQIRDIERITAKIAYNSVTPKDMEILGKSLEKLPLISNCLNCFKSPLIAEIKERLLGLEETAKVLTTAIEENAPTTIKEGHFIKKGFNEELDKYLQAKDLGKKWISDLEAKEREASGIKSLKISYNRIFGYYIEITKSFLKDVPYSYTRKQTLANCERFVTDELKQMEEKILSSEEKSLKIEIQLFYNLREMLLEKVAYLQSVAKAISILDTLYSFAIVANKHNYIKPQFSQNEIRIIDGRHPVVEALMKAKEQFVPNDTNLDCQDSRTMLITGPNMAGKSTYMRQVALITLMAHIGCFVPASKAVIPIVDRIFTRVGASDNLAFSQSTFMVEMSEVSAILHNATNNSLIILDEVGRGTSTYDGLSIARAVVEFISNNLKAKTLFATHYHELIELEGVLDGVKNYQVLIKEIASGIVFLRKIARGGADKSFGIEVAKLAGLPESVVTRAKELLIMHENDDNTNPAFNAKSNNATQLSPNDQQVLNILRELDLDNCSPLVAFNTLIDLKNKVK